MFAQSCKRGIMCRHLIKQLFIAPNGRTYNLHTKAYNPILTPDTKCSQRRTSKLPTFLDWLQHLLSSVDSSKRIEHQTWQKRHRIEISAYPHFFQKKVLYCGWLFSTALIVRGSETGATPVVVMATMTSSLRRRALVVVVLLWFVVAVVNCRQLDATLDERLPSATLGQLLMEPPPAASTRALAVAKRRRYTDGRHSWRDNRVRVWGKRTTHDDDDNDDDNADKRNWRKNTVRVWGKRHGSTTSTAADRKRTWAGNTIHVWGKPFGDAMTPKKMLDAAAARLSAAPKRSISDVMMSRLQGRLTPTSPRLLSGDVADQLMTTRSKRSSPQHRRWMVRRAAGRQRARWLEFRGPKRSWRTNVIRVWGKRSS